ncbi:MAG TPA: hypothetical protein VK489_04235 [Ferruginibacter sp.]|nr:hypothetical protein [Ferruginibacter sp.]
MKKYLLILTAIVALSNTACRKIETDGQIVLVPTGGGGGGTTGQTITVQGRITSDTIFRKANTYVLKGLVYIANNKTLTIEAGTVIKGSFSGADVAALIVTRGAKIVANGTATEPIIFTSSSPNPQSGDWGGIVICGKAPINTSFNGTPGLFEVEGGVNNASGDGLAGSGDVVVPAPVPDDSSGVLRYVRIEYAGYAFQPDKEINSLTMAAVGNKTVIENVQTYLAKDDAFEWFGGTVNCRYLVAFKTQDDDFDTDNGYSGKVQFGLSIRDSLIADASRSESFESDNNAGGTTATPKTSVVFSNMTAIGPRATTSNIGSSLYRSGAHIRRNSEMSLFNSVIIGWPLGIDIDGTTGTATSGNVGVGLILGNNFLGGNTDSIKYTASTGSAYTTADLVNYFKTPALANTILNGTVPSNLFVQPFNYAAPDPTPFGNAVSIVGTIVAPITPRASFTHVKVADPFFIPTNFIGAVAPSGALASWWKGWTRF